MENHKNALCFFYRNSFHTDFTWKSITFLTSRSKPERYFNINWFQYQSTKKRSSPEFSLGERFNLMDPVHFP